MEEQVVGDLHLRSPQTSGPTSNGSHPNADSNVDGQMDPNSTVNYYQLHWFWVVILIIISGAAVPGILVLTFLDKVIDGWTMILFPLEFIYLPTFVLTAGFVLLSRFHGTLSRRIEKRWAISGERQRKGLRILSWGWFGATLLFNTFRVGSIYSITLEESTDISSF